MPSPSQTPLSDLKPTFRRLSRAAREAQGLPALDPQDPVPAPIDIIEAQEVRPVRAQLGLSRIATISRLII